MNSEPDLPFLSVVVPVYRTAWALPELAARVSEVARRQGWTYQLLLVDDASPDGANEVAEKLALSDPAVQLLRLNENQGQHRAVMAGLAASRGRWVVVLDGDLQDPPEAIPQLLARAEEGYDAVFAARCGRYQGPVRMATSRLFKRLLRRLAGVPAGSGMYVLLSRRLVERLCACPDPHPWVVAAVGLAGLPMAAVPVERARRLQGSSGYSPWRRARSALSAVAFTLRWRWRGRGKPEGEPAWASAGTRIGQSRVNGSGRWRRFLTHAAWAGAVGALTVLLVVPLTNLTTGQVAHQAAIGVPLKYEGDELYSLALVKNVLETGWWSHNPRLAAPEGQEHLDFPTPGLAWVSLLLIRSIGLITANPFLAANLYLLATLFLVAAAGYLFFSAVGIRPLLAAGGGLLYSLLPYHLMRANGHLLLLGYYGVPLALALAIWLLRPADRRPRRWTGVLLLVAGLAPLMAGTGLYYAFFNAFFLLVAGTAGALRTRNLRRLWGGAGVALLIAALVGAALLPTWLYQRREGPNRVLAASRSHEQTETFGLKLNHLLLPAQRHRVPWLRRLTTQYQRGPLNNENTTAALGILGATGTLFLLSWLALAPFTPPPRDRLLRRRLPELAMLFLAGFLLATIGGLGSLFGLLVTAKIRAYNRISVYLALLAFAAVLLLVQHLGRRRWARHHPLLCGTACVVLFAFGVFDLVPASRFRRDPQMAARFTDDAALVSMIEERTGGQRTVFQLPYHPYPEGSYEGLRLFLHSRSFRWSAGAIRGRPQADAIERLARLPVGQLLRELPKAGFDALLVERGAYPDGGASIEESIRGEAGMDPHRSEGWLFFDLAASEDQRMR